MQSADIAIIGGEKDFNLLGLASYVTNHTDLKLNLILFGDSSAHAFHYDLNRNKLYLNNQEYNCKAIFMRGDIFKYQETKNPNDHNSAQTWKNSISAWLIANPDIKVLNRKLLTQPYFHKANSLILAKKYGIPIPETYISNSTKQINALHEEQKLIFKPINGGGHTKVLEKKFDDAIYKAGLIKEPYFFQETLEYPELRIFYIGGDFHTFRLKSKAIDHREVDIPTDIIYEASPENIKDKLESLNQEIGLRYSASDFKFCSKTKEFKFLEINTNPMFTAFDKVAEGKVCESMINALS